MGTIAASGRHNNILISDLIIFKMKLTSNITIACQFSDGTRTNRYHTGVNPEPEIGDYIYIADNLPHNGGNYWWYLGEVGVRDIHIQISPTGLVLNKIDCRD